MSQKLAQFIFQFQFLFTSLSRSVSTNAHIYPVFPHFFLIREINDSPAR
jgi:hypothetical protein